jgi:hypothetical protein
MFFFAAQVKIAFWVSKDRLVGLNHIRFCSVIPIIHGLDEIEKL